MNTFRCITAVAVQRSKSITSISCCTSDIKTASDKR